MTPISLNQQLIYAFTCFYQEVKSKSRSGLKNTMVLLAMLVDKKSLNILLADDDEDDREIFTEVVQEIAPFVKLTKATNGHDLMKQLQNKSAELPDIIFLDLNMPLKNGQECLEEIRNDERLKHIPVVIYSTSSGPEHIDETYKKGANYYIIKPDSFSELKKIAHKILSFDWDNHIRPLRDGFVLGSGLFK